MFDAVRNRKIIVKIFLLLITLPFAFFGLDSYTRSGGTGDDVAVVGDSRITLPEFQQAWRERLDKLREATNGAVDASMFDTPDARRAVLEQLIDRRVLQLAGREHRLTVGDDQLAAEITRVPNLQDDGRFSREKYLQLVASLGMSVEYFEAQLRQDMTMQQLAAAVEGGALASDLAATDLTRVMTEVRQVEVYPLTPDRFLAEVTVTDDEVRQAYDAEPKRWATPEQVRAEFVVLSADALRGEVSVSDDEVRARYEARKAEFRTADERRARHILFDAGDRAAAEKVLAELKAGGDFAALAKQYSKDPGSASSGGDLGFFARGMMAKPFEDAAFALKDHEISGIVESEFGLHIIEVTGSKAGAGKSFDEVRDELRDELEAQAVQRRFAEAAENFTNMVYEQSDSLAPVVERFKLPLQQTAWLVKGKPASQPGSPFANAKLLEAVFSVDATEQKHNTNAIEIAPNTLVAARVIEHQPAALQPFERVRDALKRALLAKAAAVKARAAGEALLADLKAGKPANVTWSAAQPVSRVLQPTLPAEVVRAALKADVKTLPAYAGVVGDDSSYRVLRIAKVEHDPNDTTTRARVKDEYQRVIAQQDFNAYVTALRTRYPVKINTTLLEAKDR